MKRRGWVIAATVVAVAYFVGWPVTATLARGAVVVYTDAEPLVCSNAPTTIAGADEDELSEHVVAAMVTKDLACELRMFIRNDSVVSAEVNEVFLPYFGGDQGMTVKATFIDGLEPIAGSELSDDPRDSGNNTLVRFDEPIVLEPGEVHLFTTTLRFSDSGCLGEGITMTLRPDAPVRVTMLGFTGDLAYSGAPFAFIGTSDEASGCTT